MQSSCGFAALERLGGLSEPPAPAWVGSSPDGGAGLGGSALAALGGTTLASRFVSWAGLSGRRYVFSVYPAADCPAFSDAILLATICDADGRRRVARIRNTGAFPEPVLARARHDLEDLGRGLEFHLHLLPSTAAERQAAIADLAALLT